ncbi:pantoate--beta-alanine ligase [Winogradskyella wandonensis]|uniref:Pantothenate synthetase n=1 Tax=Winogradskyella wandonensis TaxID=1442586 RepID=A0A4R1KRL5_9FLAO|nr:pantoate--beta-alanine ligase [Winogradskyella wandonensis]TCK67642.1 pantoate--beta-alanine ligase [Winogradskyella wandonensis]
MLQGLKIYHKKLELIQYINVLKSEFKTIGFVPTMGALHQGHLSLVNFGLEDNDYVVVSIFVNPTQFNNNEDLEKYPRTLDRDVNLLKTVSGNKIIVYAPSVEDIYEGNTVSQSFTFDGLEHEMEGAFRPGHFNGVGTIVKRLLEIVRPDYAYFGQKDFQQLQIVKKLVELHKIPTEIIGCPIFRASDGLAMSSRNERLKPEYRAAAPFIYKTLKTAKEKFGTKSAKAVTEWVAKQFKNHGLLKLEYFLIADVKTLKPVKRKSTKKTYRAFIAVYADDIRLIDNIALN